MLDRYLPADFEPQWRARWKEADLFLTQIEPGRPKFYGLDFFPYPSGAGLSVGHCRNYVPTDAICRMKRMQGFNVLHPMGFDAFGLPAENEAIKRQRHPSEMIEEYAANYRSQMDLIGISYDWSRSFKSSDPDYYKWTQWIFKLLYERGLAERRMAAVNWDPVDMTVLADEEVIAGRAERSGALVEKKYIPQWFFRITDYAQRLLDDLDDIDWPEGIKQMQRNWIGRSEGVEFEMEVVIDPESIRPKEDDGDLEIEVLEKPLKFRVFTTRIDTIFGVTFCVLAPEHPVVDQILKRVNSQRKTEIDAYRQAAREMSDIDRQAVGREKSGVRTGALAINPLTNEAVPVFIADYVLMGYGTGAIMAVPGHDDRDFEFAEKYDLDVRPVIAPEGADELPDLPFSLKEGVLINSGDFDGCSVADAQAELGQWFETNEIGERKVNFKLRDWLISRQRYWGCPIPIVYDKEGHAETVPDDALPVLLPDVESYEPSGDGTSPLAHMEEFVNVTTRDGNLGRRETDTLGGFACSSWYFLRFCDPFNEDKPFSPESVAEWMPVDCYVGGAEHAVMHLLYARFWTKVLYDAGLVSVKEPFQRLKNQGQVLGHTPYRAPREGEKLGVGEEGILISYQEAEVLPAEDVIWRWVRMSKSKGNVVTPNEAVEQYGADALRLHELFVAPFDQSVNWTNEGMNGTARFLSRSLKWVSDGRNHFESEWSNRIDSAPADERSKRIRRVTHQLIAKAESDIDRFSFNTYVAAMMTALNSYAELGFAEQMSDAERLAWSEALESFTLVLSPGAPHTADEMWEGLGHFGFTLEATWPQSNASLAADDQITVAVQVNGKLRDTIAMPAGAPKEDMEEAALASEKVQSHLSGVTIRKVIVVPGKLVNVVAS
ncbi:MAG: leucine--tRNA ligase [Fimbriimonadaceae bacterium]|nr:leucine--tRNA ligase [Fimbriimonadaceae bacterium]